VEVGRWSGIPLEERLCRVCITGQVEDELHFFCQCYVYDSLRESLYRDIQTQTGYDVRAMEAEMEWIVAVLIGHGLSTLRVRQDIAQLAGRFIFRALNLRQKTLSLTV